MWSINPPGPTKANTTHKSSDKIKAHNQKKNVGPPYKASACLACFYYAPKLTPCRVQMKVEIRKIFQITDLPSLHLCAFRFVRKKIAEQLFIIKK
jgi:hypothetical protein